MRISPINSTNTNFKAVIVPTESLGEGFKLAERCVKSGTMKDLNLTKDFLDSLAKISESPKIQRYKIDIDKRREGYTYTRINGSRISGGHNECAVKYNDDYLVVEGTKAYAKKLGGSEDSILEGLKSEVEAAEAKLFELKEQYARRLRAELEQAQKIIFNG